MIFNGYKITYTYDEYGQVKNEKTYIGKTTAVSKKQAENNFRYRCRGKQTKFFSHDYGYDCSETEQFVAEPV